MAVRKSLGSTAAIAAAVLVTLSVTGCSSTGDHKNLKPLPWPNKPSAKLGKAPQLPAANSGRGGYYKDDGPGDDIPDGLLDTPDAVVKAEPYNKWTSRPYKVLGKTYTPIGNDQPLKQRGVSTWYGKKFHGQRTASGELYDMYKMTAAHPTLPIPSYVRVTSLESGNVVVVRVNDRGPFHASRIIDVSYTAALKLGLLGQGSHEVEIERLFPGDPMVDPNRAPQARRDAASQAQSASPELAATLQEEPAAAESAAEAQPRMGSYYIQLAAYGKAASAEALGQKIKGAGVDLGGLEVVKAGAFNRLYGGPFATQADALDAMRALPASLGLRPIVVRR